MRTDQGPGTSRSGWSLRRFRTAAVLGAGVAIGVAMMASPVSGHVGNSVSHLWNAHIKPKTDARYYTKAQANTRYLPAAGTAANSDQLDGLDSTAFLPASGTAANSEQLDGLDSAAFLRTTGKAADAEQLDGVDSSQFMRGSGQAVPAAVTLPGGGLTGQVLTIAGVISVRYFCPPLSTGNGILFFDNLSPEAMNLFVEGEGTNPGFEQVASAQTTGFIAAPSGAPDVLHIQAQAPAVGVVSVDVGIAHNPTTCYVQGQAVVAK